MQAVLSRAELLLSSGCSHQPALDAAVSAMEGAVSAWARVEAQEAEKRMKEAEILKYKMQEHLVSCSICYSDVLNCLAAETFFLGAFAFDRVGSVVWCCGYNSVGMFGCPRDSQIEVWFDTVQGTSNVFTCCNVLVWVVSTPQPAVGFFSNVFPILLLRIFQIDKVLFVYPLLALMPFFSFTVNVLNVTLEACRMKKKS